MAVHGLYGWAILLVAFPPWQLAQPPQILREQSSVMLSGHFQLDSAKSYVSNHRVLPSPPGRKPKATAITYSLLLLFFCC